MVRKTDRLLIDDAISMNIHGLNIGEISQKTGISTSAIRVHFKERGHLTIRHHRIAHNAQDFPKQEAIESYVSGESIKSIAHKYGVQRKTIQDHLLRNGIQPRNRSAAMFTRMAGTTKEERERLTEAAHNAVRGKPQSREFRQKMMITRSRNRIEKFIGFGEDILKERLIQSGLDVIGQYPFDIYNLDLLINGNIAVEILSSNSFNPFNKRQYLEKTKLLLERGYFVFWIVWVDKESLMGNLENIIADIHAICRNPSSFGQYRVVRCSAKRFSRVRNEKGQITAVSAPIEFLYSDRTKECCVSR